MINTGYLQSYGDLKSDSERKKIKSDVRTEEMDDNQIVEAYEGECEECERETNVKICPICES